jgi:hypothetical protein
MNPVAQPGRPGGTNAPMQCARERLSFLQELEDSSCSWALLSGPPQTSHSQSTFARLYPGACASFLFRATTGWRQTQSQSAISGLRRVQTTLPPWSGRVTFSLPRQTGRSVFRLEDPLDGYRLTRLVQTGGSTLAFIGPPEADSGYPLVVTGPGASFSGSMEQVRMFISCFGAYETDAIS